jgi:hypothetical protein
VVEDNETTQHDISSDVRGDYVQAFVAEYSALRNEILEIQRAIRQLSLAAFASIAGLAVLIVSLVNLKNPQLLASVLLFLPLPFSAMAFAYVGHLNGVMSLDSYIKDYLAVNTNTLLRASSAQHFSPSVFHWSTYYPRKNTFSSWIIEILWAGGQAALMVIPLIGSLLGYYTVLKEFQLTPPAWWSLLFWFNVFLFIMVLVFAFLAVMRRGLITHE